jgi:hypothetical protein
MMSMTLVPRREVDEDVDVTALVVIAPGGAAEDLGVRDTVTAQHLTQLPTMGGHALARRAAERLPGG